jgi:hypothetical protein
VFDIGSIIGAIGTLWQQVAMGKLEREIANAGASALASMLVTGLWSQGVHLSTKWFGNEGEVLKDQAVAAYLTLKALEEKNFLTLTVPVDLLADNNRMSKFNIVRKAS